MVKDMTFLPLVSDTPGIAFSWHQSCEIGDASVNINFFLHDVGDARLELERTGPSFTVTTLEQLRAEDDSRELFLLIGADSLHDLPLWREPQRIQELATVVAVNRGDKPLPDRSLLEQQLGSAEAARLRFVQMPGLDLSARDIRQRSAAGRSIRYLVPRAVEAYLAHNHLYSTKAS